MGRQEQAQDSISPLLRNEPDPGAEGSRQRAPFLIPDRPTELAADHVGDIGHVQPVGMVVEKKSTAADLRRAGFCRRGYFNWRKKRDLSGWFPKDRHAVRVGSRSSARVRGPIAGRADGSCRLGAMTMDVEQGETGQAMLLIVEDDRLTREAIALLLERRGYAVEAVGDGQAALDRLRSGPVPDCILLDLGLPGVDGRQFRALQRYNPALSAVPVVVISGEPRAAETAALLGADDYFRKPVDLEQLLAAVGRYCRRVGRKP